MAYVVAIIAAGDMGSAVGARLAERGVRVTTSLAGRSAPKPSASPSPNAVGYRR
jgi:predicted dinucleotide-binding enzyme